MAFYTGDKYLLSVKKSGADSSKALVGETTSSLNITCDALEVSNKASAWKQYLPGMKGATINASLYADDEDQGQKIALNSLIAGDVVGFSFAVGQMIKYSGEAIITSIGMTFPNGAISTRELTLQVTGQVMVSD